MRGRSTTLLWPLAGLAALLALNALLNPAFFRLALVEGRVTGSLVDVLDRAAPVLLVSLGMTLVVATRGVDLSVGSLTALAGSLAAVLLVHERWPLAAALLAALGACAAAGLWNGLLVAVLRVQPIVATLILMVAGRGIAQLLTDGQIVGLEGQPGFAFLGGGSFLYLPFPLTIAFLAFALVATLARWTALGPFVEAVGSSEAASRIAGLPVTGLKLAVYALSGLCAGAAGLIQASDITAADANSVGLYLELDAILAVVLGGTALSGGRFRLLGSVVGALTIQTLTTTLLMVGITPEASLIVKALVVLVVCVLQSDALRAKNARRLPA
jgi:simple sugar transport system permease protein